MPSAAAWVFVERKENKKVCQSHHIRNQTFRKAKKKNAEHGQEEETGVFLSRDLPPYLVKGHPKGYLQGGRKGGRQNKSQSDMGIFSHFTFTFESPKQTLNYSRLFLLYG